MSRLLTESWVKTPIAPEKHVCTLGNIAIKDLVHYAMQGPLYEGSCGKVLPKLRGMVEFFLPVMS